MYKDFGRNASKRIRPKMSTANSKMQYLFWIVYIFQINYKDYEIFKLELEYMNTNPVVYWMKLFLGVIFILVSLAWWLQM